MKQGTVKYSEEFITEIGLKRWYGVELQYDMDTEDPPFDKAKKIVAQAAGAQMALNESLPPGPPPVIQIQPEDRSIGVTVEDIKSCQDLVTLDSYRIIIRSKTELELAYEERRTELVKKESQELIDAANAHVTILNKNKKQINGKR